MLGANFIAILCTSAYNDITCAVLTCAVLRTADFEQKHCTYPEYDDVVDYFYGVFQLETNIVQYSYVDRFSCYNLSPVTTLDWLFSAQLFPPCDTKDIISNNNWMHWRNYGSQCPGLK